MTIAMAPALDNIHNLLAEMRREFKAGLQRVERTVRDHRTELKKDLAAISQKPDRVRGVSDLVPASLISYSRVRTAGVVMDASSLMKSCSFPTSLPQPIELPTTPAV